MSNQKCISFLIRLITKFKNLVSNWPWNRYDRQHLFKYTETYIPNCVSIALKVLKIEAFKQTEYPFSLIEGYNKCKFGWLNLKAGIKQINSTMLRINVNLYRLSNDIFIYIRNLWILIQWIAKNAPYITGRNWNSCGKIRKQHCVISEIKHANKIVKRT